MERVLVLLHGSPSATGGEAAVVMVVGEVVSSTAAAGGALVVEVVGVDTIALVRSTVGEDDTV